MSNNNRETVREWLTEQLEIVEEGEQLAIVCLKILAGGDERTIYEVKAGNPKWGNADAMAELLWNQASRTAKGLLGFAQFQLEATFGTQQIAKPTRFLPFGVMGATQLGPANGGTAFAGLATESPTPMGQSGMNMRHQEMIVQGGFRMISEAMHIMHETNKELRAQNQELQVNNREQWLALKNALVEIQNSAASMAMKALQAEAVKKLITLSPGLVNMMAGRDIFPQSAVDASLVEAIASNLTPEEQAATIGLLNARGPGGQAVAAVLGDQLTKHNARKDAENKEMQRLSAGLPVRGYDDGLTDAGGEIIRVLKGQSVPKPIEAAQKILEASNSTTNGHAPTAQAPKPVEIPDAETFKSGDTEMIEEILSKSDRTQLPLLVPMLGQALVDKLIRRYDELTAQGKVPVP